MAEGLLLRTTGPRSVCNSPEQITNGKVHWPQSQGISVIATLASTDSAVYKQAGHIAACMHWKHPYALLTVNIWTILKTLLLVLVCIRQRLIILGIRESHTTVKCLVPIDPFTGVFNFVCQQVSQATPVTGLWLKQWVLGCP